jgi:hypothetical protein
VCRELGLSLAEYEDAVGPKNKRFHESAEAVRLTREGVIPLEDDGHDRSELDT